MPSSRATKPPHDSFMSAIGIAILFLTVFERDNPRPVKQPQLL